ncbi:DUF2269 family protein [Mesorhizobium sp.]|uniref:DUF2269 family protein n=1 Tax=Mesorhizobium sp. TaxID=1871066 RepID=UPI00121CE44D|nr:DUF2269 family protein [Mesorhizobium sp.]TIS59171.1 MAG: DUF2269 family protein [Mesorhizobium sp.]TIS90861.1 MAG: DUF2269 family protein [Mesorhizobium sp.]
MDWYSTVKFLHIVSATVWVGGGFTLMLLGVLADRADDRENVMFIMRTVAQLGNKLFAPMSILTLLFGLVMAWFWVGFSNLWIVIGLCGFAAAFLTGTFVFKPTADKMLAHIEKEGVSPAAMHLARRMLAFGKIDYAVMLVVVADMALKPTLNDTAILGGMVMVLAAGVAMALGGARRLSPAHA